MFCCLYFLGVSLSLCLSELLHPSNFSSSSLTEKDKLSSSQKIQTLFNQIASLEKFIQPNQKFAFQYIIKVTDRLKTLHCIDWQMVINLS